MGQVKRVLQNWLLPIWMLVMACFFPCAFLYFENIGEASFADLLPCFAFFLLGAGALLLLFCVLLRNLPRAALLSALVMAFSMNYVVIFGNSVPIKPTVLAFALLIAGLAFLLHKKKPDVRPICAILAVTLTALTLLNLCLNVKTLRAKLNYEPENLTLDEAACTFSGDTPNVYYFIYDEYAGAENLSEYFGYSNEDFLTALEQRGFSVSRDSYNMESLSTWTLISNLLNLSYVSNDEMEIGARVKNLEWPYLFRMFDYNGYQINLVNHTGALDEYGTNVLCSTQKDSISDLAFKNSLFSRISLCGKLYDALAQRAEVPTVTGYRDADVVLQALDAAEHAVQYADGKTLTVSYLQTPHACFYFRADGTQQDGRKELDWLDQSVYLEQLQYINTRILAAVDAILESDPNAIIILQSDHGARLTSHLRAAGRTDEAEALDERYGHNVLNCVYVPNASVDISGLSGINTLVTVFNSALGTKLPLCEDIVN